VGYRPFIYNLASSLGVLGYVKNIGSGVEVEAESDEGTLRKFVKRLERESPPMAEVTGFSVKALRAGGYRSFDVRKSSRDGNKSTLVCPDLTLCDDCLRELRSKKDRRFEYPFITCTNCGPRFSMIDNTPYDRERTSMKKFAMCPACSREYSDPSGRRFHTESNSCPSCGPELALYRKGRKVKSFDPIGRVVKLIRGGFVVAVKGVGGFHLVCDAASDRALASLRRIKGRDMKPFAIMCSEVSDARKLCRIKSDELKLLKSAERPIVLLEKKPDAGISELVAPNNKYLGVMLPYSPLHHLLLGRGLKVVVATSANLSEEPIISRRKHLKGIAGWVLDHDRDVVSSIDDSVVRIAAGRASFIRRARGYVPVPIPLPFKSSVKDVLAVGAEMKSTFTLVKNGLAFVSQHMGDLKGPGAFGHFKSTVAHFMKIFRVRPGIVARDMHPEYMSSRYSKNGIRIQHHHAHIAACMAENGLNGKVIGVALDGTGMGSDGTPWGGEFLIADYRGFERFAHLKNIALPGGDMASLEPWRMGLSYLYSVFGDDLSKLKNLPLMKKVSAKDVKLIATMIEKKLNSPSASSMGRLFDAVSAILGICLKNSYEGEAAIRLEHSIGGKTKGFYDFDLIESSGPAVIDPAGVIRGITDDFPSKDIPRRFHNTVAEMILRVCSLARERRKLNKVCLSGGCFQNRYLAERTADLLGGAGFNVFVHRKLPPNDACISFGQAAIASSVSA